MTNTAMTTTRLPVCFTLGTATTVALFWLMWTMISGPVNFIVIPAPPKLDFTRLIRDTPPAPPEIGKPERRRVSDPPPTDWTITDNGAGEGPGISVAVPVPPIDDTTTEAGPRALDSDVTPLVRIPPEYPPGAASRSVEGWVLIEFTVTRSGAVADAHVVDAEPHGVFDGAALKAIARWKYSPRVVDGDAVERRGIRAVIRFDLED